MAFKSDLTPGEESALKTIFGHLLAGDQSPTIEELSSSLNKSNKQIAHIMDELEKKDALLREKGSQKIISIYPLSLRPTEYSISFERGPTLFAMCAVDALGAPCMFNKNAKVSSICETCNADITVEIKSDRIAFLSHQSMMICNINIGVPPMAESCCPWIKFFCSKAHADQWISTNPKLTTKADLRYVKHEFPSIRERWKRYGERLSLR